MNESCLLKLGKERLKKETLKKSLKENLNRRDRTERLYDQGNVTVKRLANYSMVLLLAVHCVWPKGLQEPLTDTRPHASEHPDSSLRAHKQM